MCMLFRGLKHLKRTRDGKGDSMHDGDRAWTW